MNRNSSQRSRILLLLVLTGGLVRCGDPPRLDFRHQKHRRSGVDAGVSRDDYELDLQLLGDRRHRLISQVKGRDVRNLLPSQPAQVRKGQHAFAVIPMGNSWKRVCWRSVEVLYAGPYGASVRTEEGRRIDDVPHALIVGSERRKLRVGDIVRVHSGRRLPYGRVESVRAGSILVRTAWLGRVRQVSAARHEVLSIPRGLKLAAPVVYRFADSSRIGSFLAMARRYRWVLGAEGVVHRLPWDRVRAVSLSRRYQPGDRVRAALPIGLKLVSITRALELDLLYEVAWAQTRRRVVAFSDVVPP